ncbi:hypothetical protein [Daejeonella lutea]|uniref:Uncharacterized protein n=1 Tax=Daejeonella lutea TaxID=572036 RepID=A0A1T5A5A8_9SPHI|nr:hypothetical protein [Daejeonella lutea]SKB30118.1 hypothetical protein SAMN05661099_0336 [Daejeonella lutea]
MKLKINTILVLLFVGAIGCSTIKLGIPDQFKQQATEMHVKGLNGFTINQTLEFGNYNTSIIKNDWVFTREKTGHAWDLNAEGRILKMFNVDNLNKRTRSNTKYQYSLYGDGLESKIFCLEDKKLTESEIKTNNKWLGDFSQTRNYNYTFSAAILPLVQNFDDPWQVLLYNRYDAKRDTAKRFFDLPYIEEEGYAKNGDETITIRTIRTKNGTTAQGRDVNFPVKMPAGYELRIDDGVIGIIDTYDNNIWIYNDLDKETKLIVASISSAILLRKLGTVGTIE